MPKLIQVELKKVLKHKSIYIIILFMSVFCAINNILYKLDYDKDGRYKYEEHTNIKTTIKEYEQQLTKYNLNNEEDKTIYIDIKTKLELTKLKNSFTPNCWQYVKIESYLSEDLYKVYYYKYIIMDNQKFLSANKNYQEKLTKLKNNDWQYFLKEENKKLIINKKEIETSLVNIKDKKEILNLQNSHQKITDEIKENNYRIQNNISYNNTYLNRALTEYQSLNNQLKNYNLQTSNHSKKIKHQEMLEEKKIDEYILKNRVNLNKENNLNYQLRTIVEDYELFIIIIILMTSSILIGEELSKGTIKLLLIKPYNRHQILISKVITGLIITILAIVFLILTELLIGGILFGFTSLNMKVALYNFNTNKIISLNVFIYMLIRIIAKFPMFIILQLLCFTFSLILSNPTIVPFSITILIYTFSEIINKIILTSKIKAFQYLITANWNFKDYLFGGISKYEYLNFKKSVVIFIIYVIMLLVIMCRSFSKKDIKNI